MKYMSLLFLFFFSVVSAMEPDASQANSVPSFSHDAQESSHPPSPRNRVAFLRKRSASFSQVEQRDEKNRLYGTGGHVPSGDNQAHAKQLRARLMAVIQAAQAGAAAACCGDGNVDAGSDS